MIRSILLHPDPRLKKICKTVTTFDCDLQHLSDDMLETMYDALGIGLAASQIGIMKRILVMDCIKEGPPEPMVLINPQITWSSDELSPYEEGCLSLPEQYAEIMRPSEVNVTWQDLKGKTQERHFTDLWATCVQHEIDHLNGKLFIDHLKPLKRQMITRKMQKLKREKARTPTQAQSPQT